MFAVGLNGVPGGGFVLGGLEGDAEICMLVRDRVGILVVDVDYRMAPGEIGSLVRVGEVD